MTEFSSSRRQALQQLASMTALGAVMALRAPQALAAKTPRLSIPGVAGKVIRRQDVDYELWREAMVWHMSKPKRYPDMIVQAKSAEDVIGAVNYARENKLKVAIRAGGHNSNGASLRDGGMLIDLSAMDDIVSMRQSKSRPSSPASGVYRSSRQRAPRAWHSTCRTVHLWASAASPWAAAWAGTGRSAAAWQSTPSSAPRS